MKLLLFLFFAAAVAAGAYYNETSLREKVRVWMMDDEEKHDYLIYSRARSVVQGEWEGAANAEFPAWGDDPGEKVMPIDDKVYLVSGHLKVSAGSTQARKPWCAVVDRGKVSLTMCFVGDRVAEIIREAESGELRTKMAKVMAKSTQVVTQRTAPGMATPASAPGAWMWEKRDNPLDQKPSRH